jgi:malate dehydrogenase (oxaloacetate-decarboxylating)(NADP+)
MRPSAFELLYNPRLNKGTAFTEEERENYGLVGLLPEAVDPPESILTRVRMHLDKKPDDLEKYIYLSELQDRNERLFYQLLRSDLTTYLPLVYTPTVGAACQSFGHILRRPKGLYLSIRRKGRLKELLRNWPVRDVRFIVVTDGERILGLGDLGVNGMGIAIGKLALYTACGGVPPQASLPVTLDLGTDNDSLLSDPLYLGLREPRVRGDGYLAFIDEFVDAVQEVFPRCCIQFEDFHKDNAMMLLDRYRDRACMFNDDVQGTAGVALAGLIGGCRSSGTPLREQRVLFLGAGSAALGIADLTVAAMVRDGLPEREAVKRIFLQNSKGLVVKGTANLLPQAERYAHDLPFHADLAENVRNVKPTAIIGVSTVAKAFSRPVIEEMARLNRRPIIFPLSNPTSKSECTAEEAFSWSGGRAIFASGSPFPPLHVAGKLVVPSQANNVYVFPAIGLAVYATGARRVTDEMFLVAAEALAGQVSEDDRRHGLLFPPVANLLEAEIRTAVAVARHIVESGLATEPLSGDLESIVRSKVYDPGFAPLP